MKFLLLFFLSIIYSQGSSQPIEQINSTPKNGIKNFDQLENPFVEDKLSAEHSINQSKYSKRIIHKNFLDSGSLLVETVQYKWDGSNFVRLYRNGNKYDEHNNLIEHYWQIWEDSIWIDSRRNLYVYDSNDNFIEILSQNWFGNWENGDKREFTYDSSNNIIEELTTNSTWTPMGYEWINYKKQLYSYDNNNNLMEKTTFIWKEVDWENEYKITYGFVNGNLLEEYRQKWDSTNFVSDWYAAHTYDGRWNLIESQITYGDQISWGLKRKILYSYDNSDNLIEKQLLELNNLGWNIISKTISYYDQKNNLVEDVNQISNDDQVLVNDYRRTLTFDGDNNNTEILGYRWEDSNWSVRSLWRKKYISITGLELDMDQVSTYELLNNYPNPFNPSTTIKYSIPSVIANGVKQSQEITHVGLKVYDILGREVATLVNEQQKAGNYEVEFHSSNLTSGIYFYRIQANGFNATKKMILLK